MGKGPDWIEVGGQRYDAARLEKDRLVEEVRAARKVFIVSFPKCGRTWLRVMLARYKQLTVGASQFRLKLHMLYVEQPRPSPQFLFYHAGSNFPWSRKDHWRFRALRLWDRGFDLARRFSLERCLGSKVVFLVRDPRDVVVSYFHHRSRRLPHHRYRGGRAEFVRDPDLGIAQIVKFMNFLAAQRERFKPLLVYYEDLRANPRESMEQLLRFSGLAVEEQALADALEFGSFANMKKMELERSHGRELSARDPQDPNAFKVRKGAVGSHLEELDEADLAFVNAHLRDRLDPFFARYAARATPAAERPA
jgi:broad specificity phosphatase PhoE